MKLGMEGYGIFWAIIESLYNNANALRLDCECIAFDLRVDLFKVEWLIKESGLFVIDGECFKSKSIEERLLKRGEKSKKASESAKKRWENHANAMQTHSDGNAIKESKGKENKVKEIKDIEKELDCRKQKFAQTLNPFLERFGKDLLNAFYLYWTEPNKSKSKLRWELEKTWDLNLRLNTWASREKVINDKKQPVQPINHSGLTDSEELNELFKRKKN